MKRSFASLPPKRPSQVLGIPHLRAQQETFTGAKHVILVGSGKGGVGKSTVSGNPISDKIIQTIMNYFFYFSFQILL